MSQPNNELPEVIKDTDDGFEIDWSTIEERAEAHKRHSHSGSHHSSSSSHHSSSHHRHRHHSSPSSDSADTPKSNGTKLKHTITVDENNQSKKKLKLRYKILIGILIAIFAIVIGVLIAFFVLRYIGKNELLNYDTLKISTIEGANTEDNGQTVEYKGHTYKFNPYVTSILFMGVDKEELDLIDNKYGTAGQADAIYLLTYDVSNGRVKLLSFSRDTMVDINVYATNGDYAGTTNAQLCLSYAYGDGKELSAKNVVTSLQRVIYNIPINSYLAMDLDGISVLNDDIGGVTLTSLSTFGDFVEGEQVTLIGDQAESYVRTRDVSLLDSNNDRMNRQQQYINAYAGQLVPAVKSDLSTPVSLFNDAMPYITTSLNLSKVTFLASSIANDYSGLNMTSIPGTITAGQDGKAQFTPDTTALYEILLDTFYTKVK